MKKSPPPPAPVRTRNPWGGWYQDADVTLTGGSVLGGRYVLIINAGVCVSARGATEIEFYPFSRVAKIRIDASSKLAPDFLDDAP
jgi:hypothetical protein